MADIVSKEVRSKMMSGIKGKNTKPEVLVRRGLFANGFRYKLHDQRLPGKPDLVLPKYMTVLFVNGCFWHGHECDLFRMPSTNREFWEKKINANRLNDSKNKELLLLAGWRVVTIWECATKGKRRWNIDTLISTVSNLIKNNSGDATSEIKQQ